MGCTSSKQNNSVVIANASPETVPNDVLSGEKGPNVVIETASSSISPMSPFIDNPKVANGVAEPDIQERPPKPSLQTPKPDPRRQILTFFNSVNGASSKCTSYRNVANASNADQILEENGDNDSTGTSFFTVWRPCSSDAIRKMIEGEGVGKGLDIKGKSAKAGSLSGFVPYLQIHEEYHKSKVQTLERGGRTRIFFASQEARDAVMQELRPLQNHLLNAVQDAKRTVKQNILSLGFGMAAASRSTSKSVYRAGSTAMTSLKSTVSSTGSSVMSGSTDFLSTTKSAENGSLIEKDGVPEDKLTLSDSKEVFKSERLTIPLVVSPTSLLGNNGVPEFSSAMAASVLALGKQSSNLATRTAELIASPINDGLKKGASVTVSAVTAVSQQASESVTDMAARAAAGAKSGFELATTTASTITKPIHKSFKDLTVKGLGMGGGNDDTEVQWALKRLLWDMDDPSIRVIDDYSPSCYGIELPDRLLWQAFVVDSDISRQEGSKFYSARPSQPAFQDMNFIAISKSRKARKRNPDSTDPLVVLYQTCRGSTGDKTDSPMDPRGLVMAYEEYNRVLPVVSDFDCFTVGSKNVKYESLPVEQLELLEWCITSIEEILESHHTSKSTTWTNRWLQVLKTNATKGFHPTVPKYGFGDAKSYSIVEDAVAFLQGSGAVRHGAECFNFYFPQELDKEFLIVSNSFPEK